MAFDPEADAAATALVRTIREKIVAYKTQLLRQLEDQRDALAHGDDTDADSSSSRRNERPDVDTDSSRHSDTNRAAATSTNRQRERSGGTDAAADNVDRKKRPRESLPTVSAAALPLEPSLPASKRVVRTSTPPLKYDVQRRRTHALVNSQQQQQQPVLLASASASTSMTQSLSVDTIRPPTQTLAQLHHIFETRLHASVALARDVERHSVAATRKRQLPRLATPPRRATHWDAVLAEMQWLATDFAAERNWKRTLQHRVARDVVAAHNAERMRLERAHRTLARDVALRVSAFWRSIERIAARSRVRLEATGSADALDVAEPSDAVATDSVATMSTMAPLQIETIAVVGSDVDESVVSAAKDKMLRIVSAGRRAREAMATSSDDREAALQVLRTRTTSSSSTNRTVLATFQVLALRWMLELSAAGLNVLLNDQLGMAKAATIAAFLSLSAMLDGSKRSTGPHLVVVADTELHKWLFHLQTYRGDARVQVYGNDSATTRQQQQREWTWAPSATATDFFDGDSATDALWRDEQLPLFAVLCPLSAFVSDADAFAVCSSWQMLVVENDCDARFDDVETIAALRRVHQQQQRVLCTSRPVESWTSVAVRHAYATFLLDDGRTTNDSTDSIDGVWTHALQLDNAAATRALQACGKTASSVSALWKAANAATDRSRPVSAALVALYCLTLRRVRNEVESELGKIEEQSVACALSVSQAAQYRHALSGFAATRSALREERLREWLALVLRLRAICNCVDVLNDTDKLALADVRQLASCSGKLAELVTLLPRLVTTHRVVVYCQLDALLPVLEVLLTLLDISFVCVTGSVAMQQRALAHFSARPAVRVALASTRLSAGSLDGSTRAATVYGADAIVVVDSDWNAVCDAKLRASWAQLVVARDDVLPVYRLHCEQTVEASLLRVGACVSEKVFGELAPTELLAVPADVAVGAALDKPSWWTRNAAPGSAAALVLTTLGTCARDAEAAEQYGATDLEAPLAVHDVELDAEEHLLLANTDDLTPVEWYAVDYVHQQTDTTTPTQGASDSVSNSVGWSEASVPTATRSFDDVVALENVQRVLDGDTSSQLFYPALESAASSSGFAPVDDATVTELFDVLRATGVEAHCDVYAPPVLSHWPMMRSDDSDRANDDALRLHVSYRVPAPPPVAPAKTKSDAMGYSALTDATTKSVKTKKHRNATGSGITTAGGRAGSAGASATGVKRKLEQPPATNSFKSSNATTTKTQRVDLEGIPLADVAEFEDDDFWGDTNLDALDAASWDDASVLSGILGPTTVEAIGGTSSAAGGTSANSGSSSNSGRNATTSLDGASTTRPTTKKPKTGAGNSATGGRARKTSSAGTGSTDARDGWNATDDAVLKKLFELYGSNWTLIAHVLNATTSVSRFFCRKRTPRQCYDRYGKLIATGFGSTTGNNTGGTTGGTTGTTKPLSKSAKASAAAAATLSPDALDARVGLPANELLLVFAARHALPGLPPPSIATASAVDASRLSKPSQSKGKASGLDDLKSIRHSFDAIIQCMKRKTAPPPIPIPTSALAATELSTKASLLTVPKASTNSAKTNAVPPPHKSHLDLLALLPTGPIAPDDVIKRSKEVAAVQAAAAVASSSRDALVGGGASFSSATAASAHRKQHVVGPTTTVATAVTARGPTSSNVMTQSAGPIRPTSTAPPAATAWGGDLSSLHHMSHSNHNTVGNSVGSSASTNSIALSVGTGSSVATAAAVSANTVSSANSNSSSKPPMPVTTTTLLHVLDRMPEIKHKIQTILHRSDCSEAQKVTMIARLLSNTNAISSAGVLPVDSTGTSAPATIEQLAPAAATAIDLETPIPMPAALAAAATTPPNNSNSSSSTSTSNSAVLLESLAPSPVSTPHAFPPGASSSQSQP